MLVKYKIYVKSCAIYSVLQTVHEACCLHACMHGSIICTRMCIILYHVTILLTTGNSGFAVCQSTRQRPKNTRQRICRVLHTVKSARQSSAGIQGVCRVPFFGHTAKPLPCVLSGPRQNKVTPST